MKQILVIFFIFFLNIIGYSQKIILSRICNNGPNNTIFWQSGTDTCQIIPSINLWAKENTSSSLYKVDSNINIGDQTYIHLNANIPAIKNWEYCIEYRIICNIDTVIKFTKLAKIDDSKPDSTILDSASINPFTNSVILGWQSNKTPDFASYYLYNIDRTDPRLAENYRDTQYIDLNPINPKTRSLTYDITSSDSCDNRREYGKYFHKTIWLKAVTDTCKNIVSIEWTKYIGWEVKEYWLFRRINGNPFTPIAQLNSTTLNYNDTNVFGSLSIEYFVRAHSATNQSSSSSNLSYPQITGKSQNPKNTEIEAVSSNEKNNITIKPRLNSVSNYSEILVQKRNTNGEFEVIGIITNDNIFEDTKSKNTEINYYRLIAKNVCGQAIDTSNISHNIVLGINKEETLNKLIWSNYSTWNNPIEKHIIYRSSGNNESEAINFTAIGSTGIDTQYQDINKPIEAVSCYYIEAIEQLLNTISQSNRICLIETSDIYYPNAIIIGGINSEFTFLGKGVNLNQSEVEIYDRWGNMIYKKNDISIPWIGEDSMNNIVDTGMYFFKAKIKRGNDYVTIKGNINVIK